MLMQLSSACCLSQVVLQELSQFLLEAFFILHCFISLGSLFQSSQTLMLKKFFLSSSLAGGRLTVSGSAASLVVLPPSSAAGNLVNRVWLNITDAMHYFEGFNQAELVPPGLQCSEF